MNWNEVAVLTTSEAVEAVSNILVEHGALGVQIDDAKDYDDLRQKDWAAKGEILNVAEIPHIKEGAKVSAYFPETVLVKELLPQIKRQIVQLKDYGLAVEPAEVTTGAVAEADWATAWQQYYHPVHVTRFLTVVPSWEKYEPQQPDERLVILDPGMAFGTGTHPTTKLCMQALEMVLTGGESMIDVGTGSGVLSITAKLLGAKHIRAYDVDQVAVASAQKNLDLNPSAEGIKVAENDLLNGISEGADVIVANILTEVILPLIPQAWALLPVHGHFITSGIIEDKVEEVLTAHQKQGFHVIQTLKMGDWYSVIAQKPGEDD